jgi:hypothetical protein
MKMINSSLLKALAFSIACLFTISCSSKEDISEKNNHFSNLEISQFATSNRLKTNLELDTIIISHPEGVGKAFTKIVDDELIFFDILRAEVRKVTNSFELGEYLLTRGDGPNQVPRITTFTANETQRVFLSGWTFHCFDENWNYKSKGVMALNSPDIVEIANNPKPDMIGLYELNYYENEPMFVRDKIFIKITSSIPKLNYVMHKEFYEEGRIAAEVNLNTFKVDKILGRKTPVYTNYNLIPHHDTHYWDINSNEEIYLSFEPDSLIYVCDENLVPQRAFGVAGINMQQNYYEVTTVEDYDAYWFLAQTTKGYYKHLKVIEEDNLVFRTYNQGTNELTFGYGDNPKRMQLYKDFELIADVPVPTFFKVIGKMGDYYYADGSAENRENEDIVLYRFKLNDQ